MRSRKTWDMIVAGTLWCIWFDRNNRCFHSGGVDCTHTLHHILTLVSSWAGTIGAKKKIRLGPLFQIE